MEKTICGIATGYGQNGISIIRISGPKSKEILKNIFVFKNDKQKDFKARYLHYGYIYDGDIFLDEVLCVYMKGPNTYTGEDISEIHCHGGSIPVNKILSLCLKNGAELSERGEFTKRGFLNGKLDLAKAESIVDIINSEYEASYELAVKGLKGEFSKKIGELRNLLKEIKIKIIVNIEYPDEDIEEVVFESLKKEIEDIRNTLIDLSRTYERGKLIKDGIKVSIIGKPNVGKSSLMNILSGEERAIVTNVEGTTRDIISEKIMLGNQLIELIDTAGIRDSKDEIEKIGILKSKEAIDKSDLILFVLDGSKPLEDIDHSLIELLENKLVIPIVNKLDLERKVYDELPFKEEAIEASFKTNSGIDVLEEKVEKLFSKEDLSAKDTLIISNKRHKNLVEKSIEHLGDALISIENQEPLDLLEIDIDESYEALGEIIGENISYDILKEVFQKFCLGK